MGRSAGGSMQQTTRMDRVRKQSVRPPVDEFFFLPFLHLCTSAGGKQTGSGGVVRAREEAYINLLRSLSQVCLPAQPQLLRLH